MDSTTGEGTPCHNVSSRKLPWMHKHEHFLEFQTASPGGRLFQTFLARGVAKIRVHPPVSAYVHTSVVLLADSGGVCYSVPQVRYLGYRNSLSYCTSRGEQGLETRKYVRTCTFSVTQFYWGVGDGVPYLVAKVTRYTPYCCHPPGRWRINVLFMDYHRV